MKKILIFSFLIALATMSFGQVNWGVTKGTVFSAWPGVEQCKFDVVTQFKKPTERLTADYKYTWAGSPGEWVFLGGSKNNWDAKYGGASTDAFVMVKKGAFGASTIRTDILRTPSDMAAHKEQVAVLDYREISGKESVYILEFDWRTDFLYNSKAIKGSNGAGEEYSADVVAGYDVANVDISVANGPAFAPADFKEIWTDDFPDNKYKLFGNPTTPGINGLSGKVRTFLKENPNQKWVYPNNAYDYYLTYGSASVPMPSGEEGKWWTTQIYLDKAAATALLGAADNYTVAFDISYRYKRPDQANGEFHLDNFTLKRYLTSPGASTESGLHLYTEGYALFKTGNKSYPHSQKVDTVYENYNFLTYSQVPLAQVPEEGYLLGATVREEGGDFSGRKTVVTRIVKDGNNGAGFTEYSYLTFGEIYSVALPERDAILPAAADSINNPWLQTPGDTPAGYGYHNVFAPQDGKIAKWEALNATKGLSATNPSGDTEQPLAFGIGTAADKEQINMLLDRPGNIPGAEPYFNPNSASTTYPSEIHGKGEYRIFYSFFGREFDLDFGQSVLDVEISEDILAYDNGSLDHVEGMTGPGQALGIPFHVTNEDFLTGIQIYFEADPARTGPDTSFVMRITKDPSDLATPAWTEAKPQDLPIHTGNDTYDRRYKRPTKRGWANFEIADPDSLEPGRYWLWIINNGAESLKIGVDNDSTSYYVKFDNTAEAVRNQGNLMVRWSFENLPPEFVSTPLRPHPYYNSEGKLPVMVNIDNDPGKKVGYKIEVKDPDSKWRDLEIMTRPNYSWITFGSIDYAGDSETKAYGEHATVMATISPDSYALLGDTTITFIVLDNVSGKFTEQELKLSIVRLKQHEPNWPEAITDCSNVAAEAFKLADNTGVAAPEGWAADNYNSQVNASKWAKQGSDFFYIKDAKDRQIDASLMSPYFFIPSGTKEPTIRFSMANDMKFNTGYAGAYGYKEITKEEAESKQYRGLGDDKVVVKNVGGVDKYYVFNLADIALEVGFSDENGAVTWETTPLWTDDDLLKTAYEYHDVDNDPAQVKTSYFMDYSGVNTAGDFATVTVDLRAVAKEKFNDATKFDDKPLQFRFRYKGMNKDILDGIGALVYEGKAGIFALKDFAVLKENYCHDGLLEIFKVNLVGKHFVDNPNFFEVQPGPRHMAYSQLDSEVEYPLYVSIQNESGRDIKSPTDVFVKIYQYRKNSAGVFENINHSQPAPNTDKVVFESKLTISEILKTDTLKEVEFAEKFNPSDYVHASLTDSFVVEYELTATTWGYASWNSSAGQIDVDRPTVGNNAFVVGGRTGYDYPDITGGEVAHFDNEEQTLGVSIGELFEIKKTDYLSHLSFYAPNNIPAGKHYSWAITKVKDYNASTGSFKSEKVIWIGKAEGEYAYFTTPAVTAGSWVTVPVKYTQGSIGSGYENSVKLEPGIYLLTLNMKGGETFDVGMDKNGGRYYEGFQYQTDDMSFANNDDGVGTNPTTYPLIDGDLQFRMMFDQEEAVNNAPVYLGVNNAGDYDTFNEGGLYRSVYGTYNTDEKEFTTVTDNGVTANAFAYVYKDGDSYKGVPFTYFIECGDKDRDVVYLELVSAPKWLHDPVATGVDFPVTIPVPVAEPAVLKGIPTADFEGDNLVIVRVRDRENKNAPDVKRTAKKAIKIVVRVADGAPQVAKLNGVPTPFYEPFNTTNDTPPYGTNVRINEVSSGGSPVADVLGKNWITPAYMQATWKHYDGDKLGNWHTAEYRVSLNDYDTCHNDPRTRMIEIFPDPKSKTVGKHLSAYQFATLESRQIYIPKLEGKQKAELRFDWTTDFFKNAGGKIGELYSGNPTKGWNNADVNITAQYYDDNLQLQELPLWNETEDSTYNAKTKGWNAYGEGKHDWKKSEIDLSALQGKMVRLVFEYEGRRGGAFAMDNLTIDVAVPENWPDLAIDAVNTFNFYSIPFNQVKPQGYDVTTNVWNWSFAADLTQALMDAEDVHQDIFLNAKYMRNGKEEYNESTPLTIPVIADGQAVPYTMAGKFVPPVTKNDHGRGTYELEMELWVNVDIDDKDNEYPRQNAVLEDGAKKWVAGDTLRQEFEITEDVYHMVDTVCRATKTLTASNDGVGYAFPINTTDYLTHIYVGLDNANAGDQFYFTINDGTTTYQSRDFTVDDNSDSTFGNAPALGGNWFKLDEEYPVEAGKTYTVLVNAVPNVPLDLCYSDAGKTKPCIGLKFYNAPLELDLANMTADDPYTAHVAGGVFHPEKASYFGVAKQGMAWTSGTFALTVGDRLAPNTMEIKKAPEWVELVKQGDKWVLTAKGGVVPTNIPDNETNTVVLEYYETLTIFGVETKLGYGTIEYEIQVLDPVYHLGFDTEGTVADETQGSVAGANNVINSSANFVNVDFGVAGFGVTATEATVTNAGMASLSTPPIYIEENKEVCQPAVLYFDWKSDWEHNIGDDQIPDGTLTFNNADVAVCVSTDLGKTWNDTIWTDDPATIVATSYKPNGQPMTKGEDYDKAIKYTNGVGKVGSTVLDASQTLRTLLDMSKYKGDTVMLKFVYTSPADKDGGVFVVEQITLKEDHRAPILSASVQLEGNEDDYTLIPKKHLGKYTVKGVVTNKSFIEGSCDCEDGKAFLIGDYKKGSTNNWEMISNNVGAVAAGASSDPIVWEAYKDFTPTTQQKHMWKVQTGLYTPVIHKFPASDWVGFEVTKEEYSANDGVAEQWKEKYSADAKGVGYIFDLKKKDYLNTIKVQLDGMIDGDRFNFSIYDANKKLVHTTETFKVIPAGSTTVGDYEVLNTPKAWLNCELADDYLKLDTGRYYVLFNALADNIKIGLDTRGGKVYAGGATTGIAKGIKGFPMLNLILKNEAPVFTEVEGVVPENPNFTHRVAIGDPMAEKIMEHARVGVDYSVTFYVQDPEGEDIAEMGVAEGMAPFTVTGFENLGGGLAKATINFVPTETKDLEVSIYAEDAMGDRGYYTYNIHVVEYPEPVFTTQPVLSAVVGQTYTYVPKAVDAYTGKELAVTLVTGEGLSMNDSVLTYTPTEKGEVLVVLQASTTSSNGSVTRVAEQQFVIDVFDCVAPVLNPVPPVTIWSGDAINVPVSAENVNENALTFSVKDAPDWLTVTSTGANTAVLTGVPTEATTLTVVATNACGLSSEATLVISIYGENQAPVVDSVPDVTVTVGNSTGVIKVTARDADVDDMVSFQLVKAPTWLHLTNASFEDSVFVAELTGFVGTHVAAKEYPVVVRATDGVLFSDVEFKVIVKENAAPTLTGPAELVAEFMVENPPAVTAEFAFADADGDELSVTVIDVPAWMTYTISDSAITFVGAPKKEYVSKDEEVAESTWNCYQTITVMVSDGKEEVKVSIPVTVSFTAEALAIDEGVFADVKMYPNPSNNVVKITNINGADVTIYTLLGKAVYTSKATSSVHEISVSDLSTGTYLVKIVKGNDVTTKRLVVTK